jgi:flagellar biosynthetic protein FlhB
MAHDDKTEKPTPKRKKEARRKGQVAKSPDVSGWLIMLVGSLIIPVVFKSAEKKLVGLVDQCSNVMGNPTQAGALAVLEKGLADMAAIVLPLLGLFAVVGLAANVVQTGGMVSLHAAAPKWDKVNPIAGLKALVSVQSLWQLVKQVAKLLALVGIAYTTVSKLGHTMVGSQPAQMEPVVSYAGSKLLGLTRDVSVIGLLLGFGDFFWQRHRLNKSLKMTKHQVKEENKQTEGNPVIRGQIRRKMYRLSRARMMAAVAGADVIVVNPTHYAVALRYEPSRGNAPVVVAKGVDELAMRIKEEGRKHKVPVVSDPPLTRAIYAACDIEDAIPPELFLAVARVLAFVFTLSPIVRSAGLVHRRPISAMVA